VNRADGNSEIEGKAAKGSGERVGKGASFKSEVQNRQMTLKIPVEVSREDKTNGRNKGNKTMNLG
jgi:hypothetical protein